MRRNLERYVLDHIDEADALGDMWLSANKRRSDDGSNSGSISAYLDIRPCFDLLMRHKGDLPLDLVEELRELAPRLDGFVPVRNRIMHFRPLAADDSDTAFSIVSTLQSRFWTSSREAMTTLQGDPSWEPQVSRSDLPADRILHNLPIAEYDDTGFVGRDTETAALQTLIEKGRDSMITVTGEGGIGKTALALEVAYRIIDDPSSRFDCVLWVSLKTELLTADGVQEITGAIRSITGAQTHLTSFMRDSFGEATVELSEMLEGLETLLIVDNLESADGTEVMGLYDSLPQTVRFLFTSRVGVGEVERRFPVGAMARADSKRLFRKLARDRRLPKLYSLSDATLDEILGRLRDSPLAIRWWVLGVASGHEPSSRLKNQTDLIAFCVKSVLSGLSHGASEILRVLRVLAQPLSFDELAVYLNLEMDELRAASQELARGSLVNFAATAEGELARRIALSETARAYLPTVAPDAQLDSEIVRRSADYRKSEERRRTDERRGTLGPNVVRIRTGDDAPAAHMLRLGLQYAKSADWERAESYVQRARAINPDFWEVDRVAAFIASTSGESARAVTLYRNASHNADSEEARAVVSYYFAGHLARRMFDLPNAIPLAREAHDSLQIPQTALQLGNLLVWNHEFEEGQKVLLSVEDSATGHEEILLHSGIVDSWRRWSDAQASSHLYADAFEKGLEGFVKGLEAVQRGFADTRMYAVILESLVSAIRAAAAEPQDRAGRRARLATMLDALSKTQAGFASVNSKTLRAFTLAMAKLNRVLVSAGLKPLQLPESLKEVQALSGSSAPQRKQRHRQAGSAGALIGRVKNWNGRFGFVEHPKYPNNVYFNGNCFADRTELDSIQTGAEVMFLIEPGIAEDRPRAQSVWAAQS